jgi:hypothetical protein
MDAHAAAGAFEVRLATTSPLRGVVSFGDREPRSFEGWVALAAVVEAFVAEEARVHGDTARAA